MKQERLNFLVKIFILFFALVNGLIVAFPRIYTSEFNTIFDLLSFIKETELGVHSPTLISVFSFLLILQSLVLIIHILMTLNKKEEISWWAQYVYVFNFFVIDILFIFYFAYFEAISKFADYNYGLGTYFLLFIIQLILALILLIIQQKTQKRDKTLTTAGSVAGFKVFIRDANLERGEKELYKILVNKSFGYSGNLFLTTNRLIFSGTSVFTGKMQQISVPYRNIVEVKASKLKLWYIDEKGIKRKLSLSPDPYITNQAYGNEILSVFSFIHRVATDKKFYSKALKGGVKVKIVKQEIAIESMIAQKYSWLYSLALIIAVTAVRGVVNVIILGVILLIIIHMIIKLLVYKSVHKKRKSRLNKK